jgi:hypothetical protein
VATYAVTLVRRIPASGAAPALTELGPVKWSGLTITKECGGPGALAVVATVDSLDDSMTAALQNLIATPCELWCYRDAVLIDAGHLSGYRIQGRTIEFAGIGLLGYLGFMVRTIAYSASSTDQATIVKALIDTYQAQTYGNFGLDTSTLTATGITRDLNLLASDEAHIDQVIAEMGGRDDGFDLEVDPTTRHVLMHSPRKGADLSASVIIDARSIGEPSYAQFVTPGQVASDVAVTASSTGGINLTSSAGDATVRASFGRATMTGSFQDVSVQATLDDHAVRLVDDNKSPLHQITPGLLAVPGFEYDDIDTGDIVTYQYDAGLGLQTFTPRVKTIEVSLASGTERMSIGFF